MSQKRTRSNSNSSLLKKSIRKLSRDTDYESESPSDSDTPVRKRLVKLWKPEEDEMLQRFYKEFNGNWAKIADAIPDRNPSQCSQRWKRINPNRIKLRKQWTEEEDQQVLKLIQKYGKNWKRIENEMSGRSGKQIRERFINKLDKTINHEPFTEDEDGLIYQLYNDIGPKWSEISKKLNGRPENMVKNRFYSHIRKVHQIEVSTHDKNQDDSDYQDLQSSFPKMEFEANHSNLKQQLGTIQSQLDDEGSIPYSHNLLFKKESSFMQKMGFSMQKESYQGLSMNFDDQLQHKDSHNPLLNNSDQSMYMNVPLPDVAQIYLNVPLPRMDNSQLQRNMEYSENDNSQQNTNEYQNFLAINDQMQHMSLESNNNG